MFTYLAANRTAGYSGFVTYHVGHVYGANVSYWMIPGTFFDDWDNMPVAIALLD